MDFYEVIAKTFGSRAKQDYTILPEFTYLANDLVCKGGDMYAYWDGSTWRTSKTDLIRTIDKSVLDYSNEFKAKHVDRDVTTKLMSTHSTQVMESFQKYTKNMPEADIEFNTRIIFSDETPVEMTIPQPNCHTLHKLETHPHLMRCSTCYILKKN